MKLIIVFITAALFLPSAYAKTIAIECDSAYYVVGEKYYDLKFILDTDSNEGGFYKDGVGPSLVKVKWTPAAVIITAPKYGGGSHDISIDRATLKPSNLQSQLKSVYKFRSSSRCEIVEMQENKF